MRKTIKYKNALLSYHVYGEGMPVILLHGFGETYAIWENQFNFLKVYCKVIVPDLPGSGESELFKTDESNLTINDLSDSLHSVIDNEQIDECIMLGHSMGGYVTLSYAEKYSHKLKAFGFVHSTAFADSKEKKEIRKRGIDMMEEYGGYAFLKTTTPNLFTTAFKKERGDVVDKLIEEGRRFKKEHLQQYYYAMMNRADKTTVLKTTGLPVLFIAGTLDMAAPLNDVLKQVHQPEIAYIHIMENMAHMSMQEAPEELNILLKNFINEMA